MVAGAETQSNASKDRNRRLINDSRVSAAIFCEWQIGLWTFVSPFFLRNLKVKDLQTESKNGNKIIFERNTQKETKDMVRKDRFCVGICNNDRRYPDKLELVEN